MEKLCSRSCFLQRRAYGKVMFLHWLIAKTGLWKSYALEACLLQEGLWECYVLDPCLLQRGYGAVIFLKLASCEGGHMEKLFLQRKAYEQVLFLMLSFCKGRFMEKVCP